VEGRAAGGRRRAGSAPLRGVQPAWGLLLAPGAGAGSDHAGLLAIDEAVSALGFAVSRMDFPYRLAGRRAPDRPPVLVAAVEKAAADLASTSGVPPTRIFVGGRSMGGRICSLAVASGMPAAGLVLVSYPLHPPGRPEARRTEHFGRLLVPCLFVSGTRDAFGAPDELEDAIGAVGGPVTLRWVEGADHGMRRREAEAAQVVAAWLQASSSTPALSG
jgi:predicted alpha/beta-hydrolase family hydrolase